LIRNFADRVKVRKSPIRLRDANPPVHGNPYPAIANAGKGGFLAIAGIAQRQTGPAANSGVTRMLFRNAFLIVAGGAILHVAFVPIFIVLIGYVGFAKLDEWLAQRKRDAVCESEISNWTADPEDPESEISDGLTRIKLPQPQQIVVFRIGELLRKMR
jgi:hypothetical protein